MRSADASRALISATCASFGWGGRQAWFFRPRRSNRVGLPADSARPHSALTRFDRRGDGGPGRSPGGLPFESVRRTGRCAHAAVPDHPVRTPSPVSSALQDPFAVPDVAAPKWALMAFLPSFRPINKQVTDDPSALLMRNLQNTDFGHFFAICRKRQISCISCKPH